MDDSIILVIGFIIIVGVVITKLLYKKFVAKYPQYKEKEKAEILLFFYPLMLPMYCLILYIFNQTVLTRMVVFVDNLYKPSTYTPFLGDLGKIIDFADQNGWLPEIGTSSQAREMSLTIASSNVYVGLGLLIIVTLIGIGLYRTLHIGEYSIRSILFLHLAAFVTLIITSIIFALKAVEITDDAFWYFFPVICLMSLLSIRRYYNELKRLSCTEDFSD